MREPKSSISERLNSRAASNLLGVSISTLYRMEERGLIHSSRTPGGQRRFLKSDLEKYVHDSDSIKAPQNPSIYKKNSHTIKEARQRGLFETEAFTDEPSIVRLSRVPTPPRKTNQYDMEYPYHSAITDWLSEWEFRRSNTKTYTHNLHTYPAMFIPQVARKLIVEFSRPGETVADIFCGSGTTLVECMVLGRNALGIELNPLAAMIARAKTTPIHPETLERDLEKIISIFKKYPVRPITFTANSNLDFWFAESMASRLNALKYAIQQCHTPESRNFFFIAFSEIIRRASFTKDNEFKLVRDKGKVTNGVEIDILGEFIKIARRNIQGMLGLFTDFDENARIKLIQGDSTTDHGIPAESVDFILTSPPYGDSRTTVAYGQFSRLSSQWLGLVQDTRKDIDNLLLGGTASHRPRNLDGWAESISTTLFQTIRLIAERDSQRANEVLNFFWDLNLAFTQGIRVLKAQRFLAVVIGNRTVKAINIKTDLIIAELCEALGCVTHGILYRTIPNKRMPLENSPTNVIGVKSKTMHRESIVLLRKL